MNWKDKYVKILITDISQLKVGDLTKYETVDDNPYCEKYGLIVSIEGDTFYGNFGYTKQQAMSTDTFTKGSLPPSYKNIRIYKVPK